MVFSRPLFLSSLFFLIAIVRADVVPPAPQNGEMALEGEIGALDGLSHQLTLRATKFELPGGHSKAIAPAKVRHISLAKARVLDLRTGSALTLSDLRLSQSVRVVGKTGGANGDFMARIVAWKSPAPPVAGDEDEGIALPSVAPLLPPSQSFNRLNLRVVDAGFASPTALGDDNNSWLQETKWTGFFLSYRIRSPRGSRPDDLVHFNGLFSPTGKLITDQVSVFNNGALPFVGRTIFFRDVDPAWKSVRAEFEVQDPAAPAGADGKYSTDVSLTDIPLPTHNAADANKEVEIKPNITYTSPRGNQYTLTSITSQGSDSYRMQWEYVPVPGAEDLKAEGQRMRVTRGGSPNYSGWNSSNALWDKRGFQFYLWGISKEITKLDMSFRLVEQSRAWRPPTAFKRVSFEVPIAAIAKATPVLPRKPPVAPVVVKGNNVEARWETDRGGWNDFNGTLWLRDLNPTPETAQGSYKWLVHEVKGFGPDGKPLERVWLDKGNKEFAFHSDNTLHDATETSLGQSVEVGENDKRLAKVDLRFTVERAQEYAINHRFEHIPLPAPGEKRLYSPDDFADNILALRRIVWVRSLTDLPADKRARFNDRGLGFLLLTFDRTPLFDGGDFDTDDLRLYDETGKREVSSYGSWNDDPLNELKDGPKWTVQIDAPFTTSKLMDLLLRTTNRKWSGQREEIAIPNIAVPPRPN